MMGKYVLFKYKVSYVGFLVQQRQGLLQKPYRMAAGLPDRCRKGHRHIVAQLGGLLLRPATPAIPLCAIGLIPVVPV